MDKPVVRVLHHLARTGGTLVAKCLASMEGVCLFSENHPSGFLPEGYDFFDIMVQAQRWHGLLSEQELKDWQSAVWPLADRPHVPEADPRFLRAVALLQQRCTERGLRMLLRDWSHVDYTAKPFAFPPSYRPRLAEALEPSYRVVRTATVRHPLRQYVSLLAFRPQDQPKPEPEEFCQGCLRFAEYAREIGFIRYEDFLQDPDAVLRTVCERLEFSFDPAYAQRWMHCQTITGDQSTATEIRPQQARPVREELQATFEACDAYHRTLELLGYEE